MGEVTFIIRKFYIKVTTDEFELPIYYADSVRELAKMCGVKSEHILTIIRSKPNKYKKKEYIMVSFNDHDNS